MEWRFWTGPLCNTVFRNSHHDRSHNFGGCFLYRNGFFFQKRKITTKFYRILLEYNRRFRAALSEPDEVQANDMGGRRIGGCRNL